jgi:ligand-binding sensor domain-containing protein
MNNIISLILFSLLPLVTTTSSQQNNLSFETIDISDGLSNNSVNCIFQDNSEFIWVGTEYGLCKYDGYNFTNYIHDPTDSNSLGGFNSRDILEDNEGDLLFEQRNINFEINFLNDDFNKIISTKERRLNLLGIFKEGINNII